MTEGQNEAGAEAQRAFLALMDSDEEFGKAVEVLKTKWMDNHIKNGVGYKRLGRIIAGKAEFVEHV